MNRVDIPLIAYLKPVPSANEAVTELDAIDLGPTVTVADFFSLYESLFPTIPKEGSINSHRYMLEKAADFLGVSLESPDLTELQTEINQLRQEKFALEQSLFDLTHVAATTR